MRLFLVLLTAFIVSSCSILETNIDLLPNFEETVLSKGEHVFNEDLYIPENEMLIIQAGAHLKMAKNTKILVEGKIVAKGTKDNPIIFEGSNEGFWRGIKIEGMEDTPVLDEFWKWFKNENNTAKSKFYSKLNNGSIFDYVVIRNISTPSQKIVPANKWKAAIEAYNTALSVTHSSFENIRYIGNVQTQRSYALVSDSVFESEDMFKAINATDRTVGIFHKNTITQNYTKNRRCADGIWTNDSVALISENTISGVGDDGIDSEGAYTIILNNTITNIWDDGIDVDGSGESYIIQNNISKANDNGILVSDRSQGILVSNIIHQSESGLTLRDGAQVVVDDINLQDNKTGVAMLQNVPCALRGDDYTEIRNIIQSLSDETVKAEKIPRASSSLDLLNNFETWYSPNDEHWVFSKDNPTHQDLRMLKDIFKLLEYNISPVSNSITEQQAFCKDLKNSLYITGSVIKNNQQDLDIRNNYELEINDTEFSDEAAEKYIEAQCTDGFLCTIVDKLNVSGITYSAKKILREINSIKN